MAARQLSKPSEEAISDELLANIPVVGKAAAETTFDVLSEEESAPAAETSPEVPSSAARSPVAEQIRYEMGEAFARELDRAEAAIAGAMSEMEARLSELERALADAKAAAENERKARVDAEARLKAFKDLALR